VSEQIKCKKCGSVYELSYKKIPFRDQDAIACEVCGEQLFRWSEARIWFAKLLNKQLGHLPNLNAKDVDCES
jgi:hypothetical protein